MKSNPGAQYEISIDGVPRTYRDREDIALQAARLGEETVVAFRAGSD